MEVGISLSSEVPGSEVREQGVPTPTVVRDCPQPGTSHESLNVKKEKDSVVTREGQERKISVPKRCWKWVVSLFPGSLVQGGGDGHRSVVEMERSESKGGRVLTTLSVTHVDEESF